MLLSQQSRTSCGNIKRVLLFHYAVMEELKQSRKSLTRPKEKQIWSKLLERSLKSTGLEYTVCQSVWVLIKNVESRPPAGHHVGIHVRYTVSYVPCSKGFLDEYLFMFIDSMAVPSLLLSLIHVFYMLLTCQNKKSQ